MIEFVEVKSDERILRVAALADQIFHEHYDAYLEPDHVSFYLRKFLSPFAIKRQIQESISYYLLKSEDKIVGFMALEFAPFVFRISKLYIGQEFRNKHYGLEALNYALKIASDNKYKQVDLFVNENNLKGKKFYGMYGFVEEGKMVHTYSNGHSETDIQMILNLN